MGVPAGKAGRPPTWSGSAWLITTSSTGLGVTLAISASINLAAGGAIWASNTITPLSPTTKAELDTPPLTQ